MNKCYYFYFTDEESNIPKIKSYSKWQSWELSSGVSEYKVIQLFIVTYVSIFLLKSNILLQSKILIKGMNSPFCFLNITQIFSG